MKQTRADTWAAVAQALGLHVLLFALMFAGLRWSQHNVAEAAQGDPIEADLVAVSDLSASMQRALRRAPKALPAPPPAPDKIEPLPEPVAEEVPPPPQPKALPPPVPEPAPVEQEKVQRDAPSAEVAKVPREQEQKRRQPDQTELDAKKQAEQEREKQRQLAEIRRLREQAARERSMAEQRAQQLADARTPGTSTAPPPPGNRGTDPGLQAKYAAALQQAILRQWIRPETVALGQRCRISIRQLQGGEVVDVTISSSCPYDAAGRQSVERAIYKASPLPYAGFETVFNRNLDLNFVAEDR
ncbi:TonB C-terminal domain-containing protein [Thermomonas fusca]|uniref:TonB C-terminal domain-containing protein n=1 Tax=Thermomonas fusca TaxID=215690 RepID=UPI00040B7E4E|nr:TonB C-terminal domain-containing protein [Thermomonas fusca]